jgi:hypothetical protein
LPYNCFYTLKIGRVQAVIDYRAKAAGTGLGLFYFFHLAAIAVTITGLAACPCLVEGLRWRSKR